METVNFFGRLESTKENFWFSPSAISFAAGAFSASLVWYYTTSSPKHDKEGAFDVLRDVRSRIGELPYVRRRSRWPWDRKRSHSTSSTSSPDQKGGFPNSNQSSPETEKDTCIGSIFGLDVGGTLAKLVYFEERPESIGTQHERRSSSSCIQGSLSANNLIQDLNNVNSTQRKSQGLARHESMTDDGHYEDFHSLPVRRRSLSNHTAISNDETMRRSRSLLDIASQNNEKAEAMERFYDFARRLDSYRTGAKDHKLSFYSKQLGGEFHFIQFETRRMQNSMDLIKSNNLHHSIQRVGATGGGAHKFYNDWQQQLGITMQKQEELESLVAGMQFVMATVLGECYTFRPPKVQKQTTQKEGTQPNIDVEVTSTQRGAREDSTSHSDESPEVDSWWWSRKVQRDAITYSSTYPYMLVTIGTGVSILRVDGPRKHERVSGSTIGGGTYWGLIRLLTQIEDFEQVMRLAERGDATKVDMMVGDIYGNNSDALEKLGLPSNLVASSFGKLVAKDDPANGLTEEDLARALLLMVTNNIGQVAYLNAKLHRTPRIYFVGNFLRQNNISQRRLSYAIDFWSKGEMEALFLEHEGYFGALGAFLLTQNISESKPSAASERQSDPASAPDEEMERRSNSMFSSEIRSVLSGVFT